ncbi:hypothetical protein [Nitrobacter vulgaris]|uniref:hypothetical protein n=1 Tax=Nitrobacter vulgaris TaxID=29421 RepID=UPI00191C79E9|nr:hypothetical protein [Nitrobacter vulgaris]
MATPPKQDMPPPAVDAAGSAGQSQAADLDRRAVRALDLTDDDIAAIEASEMAPGFEHLNAEVDDT